MTLQKLNEAQRSAVIQTEGPVMVLAGPGTGKTTLLSHRILHILNTTDSRPEQILCLTFTDAGTIAMRRKLEQTMGSEAYRIHIYTFHSFCNELIRKYQDKFEVQDLKPVTELEQREIGRNILDNVPLGHPLRRNRGQVYYDLYDLLKLFEWMKREDKSAAYLKQQIEKYLEDLPNRAEFIYQRKYKEFEAGSPKTAKIAEETSRMNKLLAAAETLETYELNMREQARFDFNDMILWVIQLLLRDENVLLDLQEQYQYLMVDEFQDTNGAQFELVSLLASYWEDNPNLFVVGDDDQSIYRFQGANVENIYSFERSYTSNLHTVVLNENYRSSQSILNAAMKLIGHNSGRHLRGAESKNLKASSGQTEIPVNIISLPNELHETLFVAHSIVDLLDKGVIASEIAVIYRNHKQAERLRKYLTPLLSTRKTGMYLRKKDNVLEHPYINYLCSFLEYVSLESKSPGAGEHLLYSLLHFEGFELKPLHITSLFAYVQNNKVYKKSSFAIRMVMGNLGTLHEPELFDSRIIQEFIRVHEILEGWIKSSRHKTTLQLVEQIMYESKLVHHALRQESDSGKTIEAIQTFFDFLKEENDRKKGTSIQDILQTVSIMNEEGLKLDQESLYYRKDGVFFLSAHGAKGLEFDHVFMIDCIENQWESSRNKGMPFGLHKLFIQDENELAEEERRLFYVGMTRARTHLTISYSNADLKEKELARSRFVSEAMECESVVYKEQTYPDEQIRALMQSELQPETAVPEHFLKASFNRQLVEDYRLSVTHVSSYLRCPVEFYFNQILRIPSAMNESMSFGNAMHQSFEWLFSNYKKSNYQAFPDAEEWIKVFKKTMEQQGHNFSEAGFKRRMEAGTSWLMKLYSIYKSQWLEEIPFELEKHLSQMSIEGIPVKGVIDKMIQLKDEVLVIDYKTGKSDPKSRKEKLSRPDPNAGQSDNTLKRYGGDYWRQLVFYKLLVENDPLHKKAVNSGMIEYLEPDEDTFQRDKLFINEEDVKALLHQMHFVYNHIKQGIFEPGCGTCEWCLHVARQNHESVS